MNQSPVKNPLRRLVGQTAVYGSSTIITRLLNYLLVPLHTYIFLPESYGVVGEMYAYVSFLIVLLTYGMETAFFRYYESEKEKDKVYSTSLIALIITSSLFVVLSGIFAQPIASIIRHPAHSEYVIWFALIIAFDAISCIPFARLRALNKPKRFAAIKLIGIGVNIFLNLFFLLLCPYLLENDIMTAFIGSIYKPEVGVGYIFIANLISSAVSLALLSGGIFKVKFRFDGKLLKPMLRYALPLLIFGLAGIINETMDRLFLKYLSPENTALQQVGIYSACYKISIIMTIVIQAFKYAAEPFFFANAKADNAKQLYADVMRYFVLLCAFIFLGTMMYIDVVKYFVGKEYFVGLPVVPILLMANLFLGVFYNLSIWYKLTDKTHFGAWLAIGGAIITIILNWLLIPIMGYMGSAWATLACYFSMMVFSYIIVQKQYHVSYDLKRIFLYVLGAVTLYFVSELMPEMETWLKMSFNTVLLVVFIAVAWISEKSLKTKEAKQ